MLLVHSSKIFRLVFCNSMIFLEYDYGDDFDRQIKRWFPFEGDLDCYDISEFILYCAIIPLVLRWIYKGWKKVECKYYKD